MKNIVKMTFSAIMLAAFTACGGGGDSWTDAKGATWNFTYTEADYTATITSAKNMPSDCTVPAKVFRGAIEFAVTKIDDKAFSIYLGQECPQKMTLPEGLVTIGENAFMGSDLVSIKLASTLETIGRGAFDSNPSLTEIEIPENVWKIENYAFSYCSSLSKVTFKNFSGIIVDVATAFMDTPWLANMNANDNWANAISISGEKGSVTGYNLLATAEIGEPFYSLGHKTTMWWKWTAPAGVKLVSFDTYGSGFDTVLGVYTGTSLGSLEIKASNDDAGFNLATSLVSFETVPDTTYYICVSGNGAATGSIKLNWWKLTDDFSFVIHDGVLVGFIGFCPENITIPQNVTSIRGNAFDVDYYSVAVGQLKSVTIPGNVTEIGPYSFYGCPKLSSVAFADGLKKLGSAAFEQCAALAGKTLTLPTTVTDVDGDSFRGIGGPLTVVAPRTLKGMLTSGPYGSTELTVAWYVKLTLDPNGGALEEKYRSRTVYGTVYGDLSPAPTRTGYTFAGWKNGSTSITDSTPLPDVATATLKAQWTINKYKQTFDANGGTGGKTLTLNYNAALTTPTVTRTGYTFKGWSPAVPAKVPAKDATYKAQWTVNKYKATFDANGGTGGKTFTLEYNAPITAPTVTRAGYNLTGWEPALDAKMPAHDVTYKAKWTVVENGIFITFDANGGFGGESKYMTYNTALTAPKVTRTGYTFKGWKPAVPAKVPNTDTTYVAQWTVNRYKVIFDANGGTGGGTNTMDYGTYYVWDDMPRPTRVGYDFDGWDPEPDFYVSDTDTIYKAKWTLKTFCVEFDFNGGNDEDLYTSFSKVMNYGETLSAPNVMWRGHTFKGWSPAVPKTVPDSDDYYITYTAQWEDLKRAVTLDLGGGTGTSGLVYVTDGTLVSELPEPEWDGYAFDGWFTAKEGGEKVYWGEEITSDMALFAHWYLVGYTITFHWNDGTADEHETVGGIDHGQSLYEAVMRNAPEISRSGYTLDGWYTAAKGGEKIVEVEGMTITHSYDLYARWTPAGSGGGSTDDGSGGGSSDGGSGGGASGGGGSGAVTPTPTPTPTTTPTPTPVATDYYLYKSVSGSVLQTAASTYEGYLYKEKGKAAGNIQVKLAKPKKNRKFEGVPLTTKPTITITVSGEGKVVIKGTDVVAGQIIMEGTVGNREIHLEIGSNGMIGTFGEFRIDGVRNLFASKDKAEVTAANAVLGKWLGAVCMMSDDGTYNVTLSAKGKAKLVGTVNGEKVSSVKGQMLIGEAWSCVPLTWTKSGTRYSYTLWLKNDGSKAGVAESSSIVVAKPGTLKSGAKFSIANVDAFAELIPGVLKAQLPKSVTVSTSGVRWVLPKAGKVVFQKGTTTVDPAKELDNPSGLKLTYKSKDGSFSGSFKAYSVVNGRLKATTVEVKGIMIDGVGYGTATVKGKGSVAISVK